MVGGEPGGPPGGKPTIKFLYYNLLLLLLFVNFYIFGCPEFAVDVTNKYMIILLQANFFEVLEETD